MFDMEYSSMMFLCVFDIIMKKAAICRESSRRHFVFVMCFRATKANGVECWICSFHTNISKETRHFAED